MPRYKTSIVKTSIKGTIVENRGTIFRGIEIEQNFLYLSSKNRVPVSNINKTARKTEILIKFYYILLLATFIDRKNCAKEKVNWFGTANAVIQAFLTSSTFFRVFRVLDIF